METKKEKIHPFFKLLIILFIVFIAFYISLESGYYPSLIRKNTNLRNKEIKEFENDLKAGNQISDNGYIEENIDYSNFVTKTGNTLTYSIGKVLVEGTKGVKDIFKYLFW